MMKSQKVEYQESGVRSQKSEVRSQESEVRSQESEESGCLSFRCSLLLRLSLTGVKPGLHGRFRRKPPRSLSSSGGRGGFKTRPYMGDSYGSLGCHSGGIPPLAGGIQFHESGTWTGSGPLLPEAGFCRGDELRELRLRQRQRLSPALRGVVFLTIIPHTAGISPPGTKIVSERKTRFGYSLPAGDALLRIGVFRLDTKISMETMLIQNQSVAIHPFSLVPVP